MEMESTIETVSPAPEAEAICKTAQLAAANLRHAASALEREAQTIEAICRSNRATACFADSALIRLIVEDWQSGAFEDDYPTDLPLIAAIRGNLEL